MPMEDCARAGFADDVADRRRANEEAVVVVNGGRRRRLFQATRKFGSVAGEKEVLQIDVAEKDLLAAAFETVETAVVFFSRKSK